MDLELLLKEHAAKIAGELPGIVQRAHSEEDVRHAVNSLLDEFLRRAEIEARPWHEYGLAGGRVDSLYGGVVIEYKSPHGAGALGPSPESPGSRALIDQIKGRFNDFHNEERVEPKRLFGAGCDGNRFVFVRHRGGKFEIDGPQPSAPHVVERLLRALVSLGAKGHSFTPDQLADQFGADSELAQAGIADLYAVLSSTTNPKAKTFFDQWKILFGEVCGYNVEGKNDKVQKLAQHYGVKKARPAELLFAVHTYYAIFMKLLAAQIAVSFSPLGTSPLKRALNAASDQALRAEMQRLEQGGIWSDIGIKNFLEGDLFSWYLDAWDERLAGVVRSMLARLDSFDPSTLSVEPAESRDLLKKLYQNLFPKSVRHDLGEYYTPDWLAEHVLNEVGYDGDPDQRLLDPACGSGTFLVMAINRVKAWFEARRDSCGFGEDELLEKVLRNLIGFDLNPLAVMAARTNYLLAIRDLLHAVGTVELPVYLCDSIMTPEVHGGLAAGRLGGVMELRTAAGILLIPAEISENRDLLARYADAMEFCVRNRYSASEFLSYCANQGLPLEQEEAHEKLYEQLLKLDRENRNGIWARIIKNAFAPLFLGKVDYVAGNPPWINWESLPGDYRKAQQRVWKGYGLFTLSGGAGRLGGGKKDLSMLFTYRSADRYLGFGGRLGFVITQSVFKTKGAGDGFRGLKFYSGGQYAYLTPVVVHDLSAMQVFEGATNRTAVFVAEKTDAAFEYPVPYVEWRGPGRIPQDDSLVQVLSATERREIVAAPVESKTPNSPWLTGSETALAAARKAIGRSGFKAHAGVYTGGLNGCYWLRVLETLPDGTLLIENLHDVGKIKVEHVETVIEPDLVYPLVRGRDVDRWAAVPSAHIILAQDPATRKGIPVSQMKRRHLSRTLAYLSRFEEQLRRRSSSSVRRLMEEGPFYSMFAVGPYTMSEWKVMWPEVGTTVRAGVCGPTSVEQVKPVLADHTVVTVSCEGEQQAFFVCALANASPAQLVVSGYIVLHASPHVLEHLAIPAFDPSDPLHQRLSDLSRQCHEAAKIDAAETLKVLEQQVDEAAAELWGLTAAELKAIQDALRDR